MKLPSIIVTLLATSLLFVAPSVQADPPAFGGQPHMNGTLKHLHAAKEKASTDADTALAELHAAAGDLKTASRNKGTYKSIGRELIAQALEYLQHGDLDKANHKIDEAITAVERGGETGAHEPVTTDPNK